MYDIIKNIILDKNYTLSDIIFKINKLWLENSLTQSEADELKDLAYENIDIGNEVPDYSVQINMLNEKCTALEAAVKELQTQIGEPPAEEEYPEWVPWDGMSNNYQKGAKVTHNGVKYISEYDGQNIWEPGAPGIDERYWKIVVE